MSHKICLNFEDFDEIYEILRDHPSLSTDEGEWSFRRGLWEQNIETILKFASLPNSAIDKEGLLFTFMSQDTRSEDGGRREYIDRLFQEYDVTKLEFSENHVITLMQYIQKYNLPNESKEFDLLMDQIYMNTDNNVDMIVKFISEGYKVHGVASRVLDNLDKQQFIEAKRWTKAQAFYKKYIHDKIIEMAMTLRGQFPSPVLAQIISEAVDTSGYSEKKLLSLITPINEQRDLSEMERFTIVTEKREIEHEKGKKAMEIYLGRGDPRFISRERKLKELENAIAEDEWIEARTGQTLNLGAAHDYDLFDNGLALRREMFANEDDE